MSVRVRQKRRQNADEKSIKTLQRREVLLFAMKRISGFLCACFVKLALSRRIRAETGLT